MAFVHQGAYTKRRPTPLILPSRATAPSRGLLQSSPKELIFAAGGILKAKVPAKRLKPHPSLAKPRPAALHELPQQLLSLQSYFTGNGIEGGGEKKQPPADYRYPGLADRQAAHALQHDEKIVKVQKPQRRQEQAVRTVALQHQKLRDHVPIDRIDPLNTKTKQTPVRLPHRLFQKLKLLWFGCEVGSS